jgi:hypothetical protein
MNITRITPYYIYIYIYRERERERERERVHWILLFQPHHEMPEKLLLREYNNGPFSHMLSPSL